MKHFIKLFFVLLVSVALCNTYVFAESFCCSIGLRTGLDISENSGSKVATPVFGVVLDGKNNEQHLGVSAAFDFEVSSDDKKLLDKNKTVFQEKTQASVESLSLNFYYFYTTNNQFEIKVGPTFGVSFIQVTEPEIDKSNSVVYSIDWDGFGLDLGLAFGIEKIVSRDIILCLDCELQTNIVSSISAKDVFDTPLSIEYNRAGNAFSILPRFSIRKVL